MSTNFSEMLINCQSMVTGLQTVRKPTKEELIIIERFEKDFDSGETITDGLERAIDNLPDDFDLVRMN